MDHSGLDELAKVITLKLKDFSFKDLPVEHGLDHIPYVRLWRRKTLNTNRAVALVPMAWRYSKPGEYARSIKTVLGKKAGYFFFFYPVGLQIIVYGEDIPLDDRELLRAVDKYDTQTVVLQSVFAVDVKQKKICRRQDLGPVYYGEISGCHP